MPSAIKQLFKLPNISDASRCYASIVALYVDSKILLKSVQIVSRHPRLKF